MSEPVAYKPNLIRYSIIFGAFFILLLVVMYLAFFSERNSDTGSTKTDRMGNTLESIPKAKAVASGRGTPDYNARLSQMNDIQARQAIANNESHVPVLITGEAEPPKEVVIPKPEKKREQPVLPAPQRVETPQPKPRQNYADSRMKDALLLIKNNMQLHPPTLVANNSNANASGSKTIKNYPKQTVAEEPAEQQEKSVPSWLAVGKTVYCVNRLEVNSDIPVTDVQLRVVAPAQGNGADLYGSFKHYDEMLILEMESAVVDGQRYAIRGLAIDPKDASFNVAGDVDHHYLERYAAFFVASMVEGAAEIIENSKSSTSVSDGVIIESSGAATTRDIVAGALGKTGGRLADHLQEGLSRPTTVSLVAGAEVAVVILSSGKTTASQSNPDPISFSNTAKSKTIAVPDLEARQPLIFETN